MVLKQVEQQVPGRSRANQHNGTLAARCSCLRCCEQATGRSRQHVCINAWKKLSGLGLWCFAIVCCCHPSSPPVACVLLLLCSAAPHRQ